MRYRVITVESRVCVRGESGMSEWFDVNVGLIRDVWCPHGYLMCIRMVSLGRSMQEYERGVRLTDQWGYDWSQSATVCR